MLFDKTDNIICFRHNYNEIFSNEIISILKECDTIYFNNYNNHEICIETDNLYDYIYRDNWIKSIFNQSIDNLPNTITYLSLGEKFNKSIDNLPNSITHLTLGYDFNQPINNLPNSIIVKKLV